MAVTVPSSYRHTYMAFNNSNITLDGNTIAIHNLLFVILGCCTMPLAQCCQRFCQHKHLVAMSCDVCEEDLEHRCMLHCTSTDPHGREAVCFRCWRLQCRIHTAWSARFAFKGTLAAKPVHAVLKVVPLHSHIVVSSLHTNGHTGEQPFLCDVEGRTAPFAKCNHLSAHHWARIDEKALFLHMWMLHVGIPRPPIERPRGQARGLRREHGHVGLARVRGRGAKAQYMRSGP